MHLSLLGGGSDPGFNNTRFNQHRQKQYLRSKQFRLLKQIRVKALSFPSDMFCLNEAAKDADVSPYMKSDEFEVTIGNLREYQE